MNSSNGSPGAIITINDDDDEEESETNNNNNDRRRRSRAEKYLHGEKENLLREFQYQSHSLRVSASDVAAMTGFHPYKNLPELLMKLVYQGRLGQALLQADANLLGVEIVSEEESLIELATKAGGDTVSALKSALMVKDGSRKVANVQEASKIKKKIMEEAKKTTKLNKQELEILKEGSRSAVDTGYGTANEGEALDLYEATVGWQVMERNAEVRAWPFQRQEDVAGAASVSRAAEEEGDDAGEKNDNCDHVVTPLIIKGGSFDVCGEKGKKLRTVVPLRKAHLLWKPQLPASDSKRQKTSITLASSATESLEENTFISANDGSSADNGFNDGNKGMSINNEVRPFFSILGSVDGIRDELAPLLSSASSGDDDSWAMQKVIVECKHRMNRIYKVPPLYDQIQAAVYCFMYEVNEADIVQVMRHKSSTNRSSAATPKELLSTLEGGEPPGSIVPKSLAKSKESESQRSLNNGSTGNSATLRNDPTQLEQESKQKPVSISVSRLSLDDPIMQHRKQWADVVLPRLRSFVEAVFAVRRDDQKRYSLLAAVGSANHDHNENSISGECSWRILHEECPFLETCDTAFHRKD